MVIEVARKNTIVRRICVLSDRNKRLLARRLLKISVRNYFFLKIYASSEGAVSHNVIYYQQLSNPCRKASLHSWNFHVWLLLYRSLQVCLLISITLTKPIYYLSIMCIALHVCLLMVLDVFLNPFSFLLPWFVEDSCKLWVKLQFGWKVIRKTLRISELARWHPAIIYCKTELFLPYINCMTSSYHKGGGIIFKLTIYIHFFLWRMERILQTIGAYCTCKLLSFSMMDVDTDDPFVVFNYVTNVNLHAIP